MISEAAAQTSNSPYWLCTAHAPRYVFQIGVDGGNGNTVCPGGGTPQFLGQYCLALENQCTNWVSADSYLVANVFPAAGDATELV